MKIMVTGGAGFIGSALIRHLINNTKHEIINIDKLTYAGNTDSLREIERCNRYRLEEIDICDKDKIQDIFLSFQPNIVMHGSSSVPQEWLDIINKYGGEIPQTYGVPVEEIQEGIRNGVRKVNIDTDNRLAFTAAVREAAFADKANFDPRHFNKPARKYMKQVCLDRYKQFWCEGQASKIKQNSTNYFADLYAKGDLDPKVKATV